MIESINAVMEQLRTAACSDYFGDHPDRADSVAQSIYEAAYAKAWNDCTTQTAEVSDQLLKAAHLTLATFNGRGLSIPEEVGDALVAAVAKAEGRAPRLACGTSDPMDGADRGVALNRVVWKLAEAMGRVPNGADKISVEISEVINAACAALQATAPAEPLWSGWACQYPGKLPRLYGAREIAKVNLDADNGDRLLFLQAQGGA